jgi:hypothetical protein
LTYVFEPNDDGSNLNGASGSLGVRGDLRIAAIFIDGNSGVLAYNNFPNDGDMVLDSGDNFFNITTNNSRRLRNVAAHEHGHGMGLLHVCPILQTKLMEPFVSTLFDGPQHDDIRGAQRHYGDPSEPDNNAGAATDIGALAANSSIDVGAISPPSNGSLLSIDANSESDWFRFTTTESLAVTATVTPVGLTYDNSPQNCGGQTANCCSGSFTDSLSIANLNAQIVDTDGSTVLATGDSQPIGAAESTPDVPLLAAGDYFVRVFEGNIPTQAQLYALSVAAVPAAPLTLTSIAVLEGGIENTPYVIPHASLLAASDAFSASGMPIGFRIESVTSGALAQNGVAVVTGVTVCLPGDALSWTPPADAVGALNAFAVRAWDGGMVSDSDVQVRIEIGADADGEGIIDPDDNCPDAPNVDQADGDGDGIGDACDLCSINDASGDRDGDGVCDDLDPCPDDNPDDSDGDSVCDGVDVCPGADDAVDADANGTPDCLEPTQALPMQQSEPGGCCAPGVFPIVGVVTPMVLIGWKRRRQDRMNRA